MSLHDVILMIEGKKTWLIFLFNLKYTLDHFSFTFSLPRFAEKIELQMSHFLKFLLNARNLTHCGSKTSALSLTHVSDKYLLVKSVHWLLWNRTSNSHYLRVMLFDRSNQVRLQMKMPQLGKHWRDLTKL